ncbi:MAG: hypothetical protein V3T25_00140 [Gemmatimonadota bacterium]
MRLGSIFALGASLSLLAAPRADAQSVIPAPPDTVSVVPGPDYAAGGFHRFLWGAHYRDAWTSSIRVPVLDLSVYAGGLTPLSAGGGLQTKSLWFAGADGKPYAFRSVYKNATPLVPELLRNTFVESIAQDQMSTQFPAGALVADSLLVAAGVPHARPELWVLPDDASLGEFREEFGGVLGLLQERPVDEDEAIAAFAGAEDVIGSEELMDLVQETPAERVDSRAYLAARLLDMLVSDWDRHADQWKWARFADSTPGWRPIPRDRDQAFAKFDGLLPSLGRQRFPAVSTFGEKYGNVLRLHYNARFQDRRFLTELERAVWDSTAAVLASRLTDRVIQGAVERLPSEIQAVEGDFVLGALISRRDDLPKASSELYALLAREPYVHATDAAEIAEVSTALGGGGVEVSIRSAAPDSEPYFRRRFERGETSEIRLYLHGGDDRVVFRGERGFPIKVRVIGGPGDDEFHFATRTGNVRLYDWRGTNRVTGERSGGINARPYPDAPLIPAPNSKPPPRHWGGMGFGMATIGYSPDYFLVLGYGYTWFDYGFRKDPYASKIKLEGRVATKGRGALRFQADFRPENSSLFVPIDVNLSSLEILHFYGVGNDTVLPPGLDSGDDFFDVRQIVLRGEGGLGWSFGPLADLALVVSGGYSNTSDDPDRLVGQLNPYGADDFTSLGTLLRFDLQTRRPGLFEPADPSPHLWLHVGGGFYPAILDVVEPYGTAELASGVGFPLGWRQSEFAVRAGGKKVWGLAPFYDLAYIGGNESLRGWPVQRFAGDASLYGSGSLRLDLFDYRLIFPSSFGILGMFDLGRVWVEGESPGGFHTGYGGGIWIALRGTRSIFSITYATSTQDQGLYIKMGFAY